MWIKVSLVMEILAAALLAVDVLLEKPRLAKIDKWLLKRLKKNIVEEGRVSSVGSVIAGVLTLLVLGGMVVYGFVIDFYQQKPIDNLIVSSIMLMAGTFAGIAMAVGVVWLHGKWSYLTRLNPLIFVNQTSLALALIILFVQWGLSHYVSSVALVSYSLASSVSVALTGLWIVAIPTTQKYLSFHSGVLIRLGLLIFIIAKLIQFLSPS